MNVYLGYLLEAFMGRKWVCLVPLLGLITGFCACSRQESVQRKAESQTTLARRLAEADRAILLNAADGATLTIMGESLKKLVDAIGASQKIPRRRSDGEIGASPGHTLIFFRASVPLGTVLTTDIILWIDGVPYHEKSGTLRAVYEKFWEKHPSSFSGRCL